MTSQKKKCKTQQKDGFTLQKQLKPRMACLGCRL